MTPSNVISLADNAEGRTAGRSTGAATVPVTEGVELAMRLIGDHCLDAVALLDRHGRYRYANPAHSRMFGEAAHTLLENVNTWLHPDDQTRALRNFMETVRTGKSGRYDFCNIINGIKLLIETQIIPVPDADGATGLVATISRDVTEQRQTEQSLRLRETQLNSVRAAFRLGTWDWDVSCDTVNWSPETYEIFGVDDNFETTLANIFKLIRPTNLALARQIARGQVPVETLHRTPYSLIRPDGKARLIEISGTVSHDEYGKIRRVVGVVHDVTERKIVEDQARLSEEHFHLMIENAREYAICMLDRDGLITSWNLGAERIMGYLAEEILGQDFACFFTPEDRRRDHPAELLGLIRQNGRYEGDGWHVRKIGSRFWAHAIMTPLFGETGDLQGFSMIIHDITERQRDKEDLRDYTERLRATSRRLVELQEIERRQLSNELHDRVGQNLTALGINLGIVRKELPADSPADMVARLEESSRLVRRTAESMRNVRAELRPQALDDYGLFSALRMVAAGFTQRTGIQAAITGTDVSPAIPDSVSLAMFRIVQEALTNVAKHAQANEVEICLDEKAGLIRLEVRDNGIGFDATIVQQLKPIRSWGLRIMRERAESVGARLAIDAKPGNGSRIFTEYRLD